MGKNTVRNVVLTAALSLASMAATAEEVTGYYAGIALGQSRIDATEFGFNFAASHMGFKAFAGYQFSDYLSAELGYADFGKPGQDFSGINVSLDTQFFQASVIGSYPVNPVFSPYVRVGAVQWKSDSLATDGITSATDSDDGTDISYGVGAMFSNRRANAQLRLDYEMADIDGSDARFISLSLVYLFQ